MSHPNQVVPAFKARLEAAKAAAAPKPKRVRKPRAKPAKAK